MSLRDRVSNIAKQAVDDYITITGYLRSNQSNSASVTLGVVAGFNSDGTINVITSDGSTQNVYTGGTRPLGNGDAVVISNGLIIA